jgi:glycosyltransferase involved in cell wall biosynthesis
LLLKINLLFAPVIVSYSRYQIELWCKEFAVSADKFVLLPYAIDVDFYTRGIEKAKTSLNKNEPFVFAAGRDLGREYATLVRATKKAGVKLKLVIPPYLVPTEANNNPNVEILTNLPYVQLFNIYAQATMVVVPLRKGVDYPSGIRAVLESLLIGKATIATYTPILNEYIPKNSDALIYVEPENENALYSAIVNIKNDIHLRLNLEKCGPELVKNVFSMASFTDALERLIAKQFETPPARSRNA